VAQKKKKSVFRKIISMVFSLLVTGGGLGGWALHHASSVRSTGEHVKDNLNIRDVVADAWSKKADALPSDAQVHPTSSRWSGPVTPGAVGSMASAGVQTPGGDSICIASFNIQVFGTLKLSKPEVMDILVKVVRRFDIVAVQEIRSKDDSIIPTFVQMINADGSQYAHVIGPRLGRSVSTEQYVFLYNRRTVELDPRSVLTLSDPEDHLHREPLIAHFNVRGTDRAQPFSFWLMNIHTDPDEAKDEVNALADGFVSVQQKGWGEDDVIVLGDLNVDEHHLGRLGSLPGMHHVIAGVPTNTRGNRTYDNMLFDSRTTTEFMGEAGVLNLMQEYRLTEQQALKVSDHMPIWATFSAFEGGRAGCMAARQPQAQQPQARQPRRRW